MFLDTDRHGSGYEPHQIPSICSSFPSPALPPISPVFSLVWGWLETHNEPLSVPSELSEAMMCHPCRALLSEADVCVSEKRLLASVSTCHKRKDVAQKGPQHSVTTMKAFFSFFSRVLFLFFEKSELTAKNAPVFKFISNLPSPQLSYWTNIYVLLHLEARW